MNATEQLNVLFTSWENSIQDYKGIFVKDGIINEAQWNITFPKILFVTKEANQYGKPVAGDFRDDWQNNFSKYPFAYRIAEWSFGIINKFPEFDKISKVPSLYHSTLQRIAFLNIKKSGGIGLSNGFEIGKHFDQNVPFLLQEIEIINPNIIFLVYHLILSSSKNYLRAAFGSPQVMKLILENGTTVN